MTSKTTRVVFALLAVCALLVLLSPVGVAVRAKSEPPVPSNIRLTPPAPVFSDKERVAELMTTGRLDPHITRTYPLARADEALALVESGHASGKLVIDLSL